MSIPALSYAFRCIALTGLLVQRLGPLAAVLCFEVALVLLALSATLNRGLRTARPIADL